MRVIVVVCTIVFASSCFAQEPAPVALESAGLSLDAFGIANEQRFEYQRLRDKEWSTLGTFRLSSRPTEGKPEVELEDELSIDRAVRKMGIRFRQRCRVEVLLPVIDGALTFSSDGEGASPMNEEVGFAVAGGKFTARKGDSTRELDWPAGTTTDMALFRLVTLLPTTPDRRYTVAHVLEMEDAQIRPGCELRCRGPASIERGGSTIATTRFEMARGERIVTELYVAGPLQLERAVFDGSKRIERVAEAK